MPVCSAMPVDSLLSSSEVWCFCPCTWPWSVRMLTGWLRYAERICHPPWRDAVENSSGLFVGESDWYSDCHGFESAGLCVFFFFFHSAKLSEISAQVTCLALCFNNDFFFNQYVTRLSSSSLVFLQLLIRKSVRVVCGWSLVRIPELFVVIYDYPLSRFSSSGLFVRDSHYKQKRKKKFFFFCS